MVDKKETFSYVPTCFEQPSSPYGDMTSESLPKMHFEMMLLSVPPLISRDMTLSLGARGLS